MNVRYYYFFFFQIYVLQKSRALFHVLGQKCQECGSYNTCGTDAPDDDGDKPRGGADNTGEGPAEDSPEGPTRAADGGGTQ